MTALTADRPTQRRDNNFLHLPAAAAKKFFTGALVCVDASGNATPGATALGLRGIGRCAVYTDNSLGIAGALNVVIEKGCFRWNNSAGMDAIAAVNIGQVCYVVDDNTVALTDGGGTRSRAGYVVNVDSLGLVDVMSGADRDVANKVFLQLPIADLLAADAKTYGVISPVNGLITNIRWSLEGAALTGANATITGNIAATPITGGVVTIVQAGSAVGNSGAAAPTAANTVAAGGRIDFTVGGGNTAAAAQAMLVIEITY